MCGRYTLLKDELKLRERFRIKHEIEGYQPNYNVAPGQQVLAVIHDGKKRRAGFLKWGLDPSWAKDERIGNRMINARSETAHEKPSFKHLMAKKRCLILADSFYEWKPTEEGKIPQRIQLADNKPFAFAGLWDKWQSGEKVLFTCTILTKDANEALQPIHHRMPIILPEEKEEEWIQPSFANAKEAHDFLMNVKFEESFTIYPVSTYVNNVRNNDPKCIEPIATSS